MSSIKDQAARTKLQYLERVIAQAFKEGATAEAIDAHLIEQGVAEPELWRSRVEIRKVNRLLGGIELDKLGGRNAFRASFQLAPIPETKDPEFDFPLTELGDAEHFAQMFADKVRHNHRTGKWLLSDDLTGLWLIDPTEQLLKLAGDSMRVRQQKAVDIEDNAKRKLYSDWTMRGENYSRLTHMLKIAEALEPLADAGDGWDAIPHLLGVQNGVVDLRTGECRRALPEEQITKRITVSYDPSVRSELWERTLDKIFATPQIVPSPSPADLLEAPVAPVDVIDLERDEMVAYIQRAFGYSFTGDCREECFFVLHGEGGNGKGTISQTIQALAGDYHDEMPASTLEKNKFGTGIPTDLAKLDGKRYSTCKEVNEFTINENRVKAITGRDSISARFMRQDFFTFTPVAKIWIESNNKPKITGTDDGMWRRVHLIPFLNKFAGEAGENKSLKDTLKEPLHLQGILTWVVEGAIRWYQMGLKPPKAVIEATEQYRHESDGLSSFLDAMCIVDAKAQVQGQDIWQAYQHYCNESSVEELWRLGQKTFFQNLGRRFTKKEGRHAVYSGVGILDKSGRNGASEGRF